MRHWMMECLRWLGLAASRTLETATSGLMGSSYRPGLENLEGRINPAPLLLRPLSAISMAAESGDAAQPVEEAKEIAFPIQHSQKGVGLGLVTEMTPRANPQVVDALFNSLAQQQQEEEINKLVALDSALGASNSEAVRKVTNPAQERHIDSALLGWALAGGALMTTWWVGDDERYGKRVSGAGLRLAA